MNNKLSCLLAFTVLLGMLNAAPAVSFVSPTPASGTSSLNTSYVFNVTSLGASSLSNFSWNWNGTNYSMYDSSLQLMLNFNNFFSDDFNDNSLAWSGTPANGMTVAETGGALMFSGDSDGGWAYMYPPISTFQGDFDMSADFNSTNLPSTGNANLDMRVVSGSGNDLVIQKSRGTGWNSYWSTCDIGGVSVNTTSVSTTDNTGKMRLVRNGTKLYTYYWSGSAWTQLLACSGGFTGPVTATLDSASASGPAYANVSYDNFIFAPLSGMDDLSPQNTQSFVINGSKKGASGRNGYALTFNGVGDYINLGNHSGGLRFGSNYTLAMWVKPNNALKEYQELYMDWGYCFSNNRSFVLAIRNVSPSSFYFQFTSDSDGALGGSDSLNSSTLSVGPWYHVVAVHNGTAMLLYINGTLAGTYNAQPSLNNFGEVYIGTNGGVGEYTYNGSMDEVRLWNRTMSASEIYQVYSSSLDRPDTSNWSFSSSMPNLAVGSYSYSACANGSGQNCTETRTLNVLPFIMQYLSPTPANGTGSPNVSYVFNLTLSNASGMNSFLWNWNGTNYSFYDSSLVGMWNFNDMEPNDDFSDASINTTRWGLYGNTASLPHINSGRLAFNTSTASWDYPRAQLKRQFIGDFDVQVDFNTSNWPNPPSGKYYELCFSEMGTYIYYFCYYMSPVPTRYISTYQTETNGSWQYNPGPTVTQIAGKLRLVRTGGTLTAYFWNSSSAWQRVANQTSAGVSIPAYVDIHLSNQDSGVQLPETFLDNFIVNSGKIAADSSLQANNASMSGAFIAGKYGTGINATPYAYASVPNTAALENITEGSFTWSAWYYPQSAPASDGSFFHNIHAIICKQGFHTFIGFANVSNITGFYFSIYNSSSIGAGGFLGNYPIRNWYHTVLSVNRTSPTNANYAFYVNNALLTSGSLAGPAYEYNQNPIRIGECMDPVQNYDWPANGTIDDVRIWNRTLSAAEVRQQYFGSLNKFDSSSWGFSANEQGISAGAYNYSACANASGGQGCIGPQYLNVLPPAAAFVSPTPANNTVSSNLSSLFNISITNTTEMNQFKWNWNGTNYTMYDSSLLGAWNFEDAEISDNFSGTVLNASLWTDGANGYASVNNGLFINAPAGAEIWPTLYLNSRILSDFDLQVDYSSISGYQASGTIGVFSNAWADYFVIHRSNTTFYCTKAVNGTTTDIGLAVPGASGRMRVVRSGNNGLCYYWNYTASSWTLFGNHTGLPPLSNGYAFLQSYRSPGYSSNASFNNFIVNSGEQLADISLTNSTAFLFGRAGITAGKYGNGLSVDGTNYAASNSSVLWNSTQSSFTWSAWYYPKALPPSVATHDLSTIICKQGFHAILFYTNASAFGFWIWNSSDAAFQYASTSTYPMNMWHHAVLAVNSSSHFIQLFVDGQPAGNMTYSGTLRNYGTNQLRIGGCYDYGAAYDYMANGTIDDVRVWNRTLSAYEITQQYYSSLNRNDPQTWSFSTNVSGFFNGNYSYYACANGSNGQGCSETRNLMFFSYPAPPYMSSLLLNSSSGRNISSDNLTAYPQNLLDMNGDNISIAYDWRKGGAGTLLNMNFDVNNSAGAGKALDYSAFGNNATIIGMDGLRTQFLMQASSNSYVLEDLTSVADYTITSGSCVEYDVFLPVSGTLIAFDYSTSDSTTLRDSGSVDQNGLGAHPANDLSAYAFRSWYHRKIAIPSGHTGKSITKYDIVCENDAAGTYTAYFRNITITDCAGSIRKTVYAGGAYTHAVHMSSSGSASGFGTDYEKNGYNRTGGWNGTGAYAFDGLDDYMVSSAPSSSNNAISVEAWVNHNALPINTIQRYVTVGGEIAVIREFALSGMTSALHFYITLNGSIYSIYVNNTLQTGKWYHIVGTWDGAAQRLYKNGVEIGNATPSGTLNPISGVIYTSVPVEVMNGTIDNVRVYNRSLSAQEVLALYNNRTDLIVSNDISGGQNWSVCATPNDGTADGNTTCSNPLYISGTCNSATRSFACGDSVNESCTMNGNMSASGTNCFNVTAANVAIDCAGNSITDSNVNNTRGIYSTQSNTSVRNCRISGFDTGVFFNSASNGTIENSYVSSAVNNVVGPTYASAVVLYNGANGNRISNVTAFSQYFASLLLFTNSRYNSVSNSILISNGTTYSLGMVNGCHGNAVTNTSVYGMAIDYGAMTIHSSSNNTVENCTLNGLGGKYALSVWYYDGLPTASNRIAGNRLLNATGLLYFGNNSAGNTACLNNFSATSGVYINDTNGSNSYNCTYAGLNQGNIYANVQNGSVWVKGNVDSSISGQYIGHSGSGFPYNTANSLGKISGNATDYAPLTNTFGYLLVSAMQSPQNGTAVYYGNGTLNVTVNYSGSGVNCTAALYAGALSAIGNATHALGNLAAGNSTSFILNLGDAANLYGADYNVLVNTTCADASLSSAAQISVYHNWSLVNNFIGQTSFNTYDVGDYVRYTLDVSRDGLPFNVTGGGALQYNLTSGALALLGSQNTGVMQLVGAGKYYGKVYFTQAMKNSACVQINCPVRSDSSFYAPNGTALASMSHYDQIAGNATQIAITSSSYGFSLSNASENTVLNLSVFNSNAAINWSGSELNLSISNPLNLDGAVILANGFAYVNSTYYPGLNSTPYEYEPFGASVTLNGVDCAKGRVYYGTGSSRAAVLASNYPCGSLCMNLSCANGTATFRVSGFSGYAYGVNSNLAVFDTTDSATIEINRTVRFFANYTNSSGAAIPDGACNLTENSGGSYSSPVAMAYNATAMLYEYGKTFPVNGTFMFNASCFSSSGWDNLSANDSFTISPPAFPGIAISAPIAATYTYTIIQLNYTATNASACWYYLNGIGPTALTGCANTTITGTEGSNNITVYANSSTGNINRSTVLFSVDTIAPGISVQSPANSTYNTTGISLSYSASGAASCWYYLNGAGPSALPGCANTSITATEGSNSVSVYANDSAGNQNSSTVYFGVDTIAPSVGVQVPANATYNRTNIALGYTVSGASMCWYYLNGAGPTTLPGCANTTITATEGSNSVAVYANDSIGNQNSSTVYFGVDSIAPGVSVQSPANITYNATNISLAYSVSGASSCWYYLNGIGPNALPGCANTTITASEGSNNITVYANDSIGNANRSTVFFGVVTVVPNAPDITAFNTSACTNFNSVPDLTNVTNLTLASPEAQISFPANYSVNAGNENYSRNVVLGAGVLAVNTTALNPTFNSAATITLYNVSCPAAVYYAPGFVANRSAILALNMRCNSTTNPACTNINCTGTTLSFTVPHFSSYSYGVATNLGIWDGTDSAPANIGDTIGFFANFTYADNLTVTDGNCIIRFYDGSWTTYSAMPYNSTSALYEYARNFSSSAFSQFGVVCNTSDNVYTLSANDAIAINSPTNVTFLGRFTTNSSGNTSTEGGNISVQNISSTTLTDRWAGMYGNVSGSIYLTDSDTGMLNSLYSWSVSDPNRLVVCASTNTAYPFSSAGAGTGSDIDAAWSFGAASDNGSSTFNSTSCTLTLIEGIISNTGTAAHQGASSFSTCIAKSGSGKSNLAFCTAINQSGKTYSNQTSKYELIVPTSFGTGIVETYYLYAELG
jgi:hypothetical protein